MNGQKLRVFREFRNYSQEYIADKLGITQNAYSRIENNQTKMTAERLSQLAGILNVPPMDLLSDKEPVIRCADPYPETAMDRITALENELAALRRERDKIFHLIEKLAARS